MIQNVEFVVI